MRLKVEQTAEEEAVRLGGGSAQQREVQPLQSAAESVAASSRRCRHRFLDKRVAAVGLLEEQAERGSGTGLDGIDRGLRERLNVVLNVHACGNRCRRSIVRVMTRRLTAVMRGGSGAAPPAMASLARPAVGATAQPVVLTEPGCGRSVEVAQELLTRVGTAGLLAVVALLVLGAATGKTWCLSAGHGRVHDPEDLYEALLFLTLARAHSSGRADK